MEDTTEAGDLAYPDTVTEAVESVDTTTWDPYEAATVQPARPEILLPSDSSFGPLFGEVTPDRIQQTLHDLTTHKGVDGNGPSNMFHNCPMAVNIEEKCHCMITFSHRFIKSYLTFLCRCRQGEQVQPVSWRQ